MHFHSLRTLRQIGGGRGAAALETARTVAYAAYFPLLLVAMVVAPVLLFHLGLSALNAVEYSLLGVGIAYAVGLGALCR